MSILLSFHPASSKIISNLLLLIILIISTLSSISSSNEISKECRQYCESNRPPGINGVYDLSCPLNQDYDSASPSFTMDCVDETCEKIGCSDDICKNGAVQCPPSEETTTSTTPPPPPEQKTGSEKSRSFDDDWDNRNKHSSSDFPGIPIWFWFIFGVIVVISCISICCGLANRGNRGYGYGGGGYYHDNGCGGGHYHHNDGCGGGYHHHHHNDGCGGGGYHNDGCGGGYYGTTYPAYAYPAPPMAYMSSTVMPVQSTMSRTHTLASPQITSSAHL